MGVRSTTRTMGLPVGVLLLAMASSASAFSAGFVSLLPRGSHSCSTTPTLAPAAAIKSRASPLIVMAAAAAKKAAADKPKRPLSAYFIFAGEKRPEVKKTHPELSNTEIVKKLGEEWRALSDAKKKAKYKVAADKTPKKPLSAYMIFSNKVRPEVKKANPTAAFGDIAKLIGKQWSEMTPAAKQEYIALEEKGKKEFAAMNK